MKTVYPILIPNSNSSRCDYGSIEIDSENCVVISGYAATWDYDSNSDILLGGAFQKSIANLKKIKRNIPIFLDHQSSLIVGVFVTETFVEDHIGLYVSGFLDLNIEAMDFLYESLKDIKGLGLSVGGRIGGDYNESGAFVANEFELEEVSLASDPINKFSVITEFYKLGE